MLILGDASERTNKTACFKILTEPHRHDKNIVKSVKTRLSTLRKVQIEPDQLP